MTSAAKLEDTPRLRSPAVAGLGRFTALMTLAAAYAVCGKVGLLLAIPPGYATAVWPASGIALAALLLGGRGLWPGVLLGSMLVNLWTSSDFTDLSGMVRSVALALVIGGGASLQALVGEALLRKDDPVRNILLRESASIRVLLLGGPVASLVSASVGVTSLWLAGLVPGSSLLFNWWTWWVGDAIGVMLFTPLVLVWALRPAATWRRRQLAITLPLAGMFAGVVWLFFLASAHEEARIAGQFQKQASEHAGRVEARLEDYVVILGAVERFYASSRSVEPEEFRRFTEHFLRDQPGLTALAFNQLIPDASGPHVFVRSIEPAQENLEVLGVDLGSEPVRRAVFEQASGAHAARASAALRLVQRPDRADGVLLAMPVENPEAQAPGAPRGFAVAVFQAGELLDSVGAPPDGITLRLVDATDGARETLYAGAEPPAPGDAALVLPLRWAGREWQLHYAMPAALRVANRSWQALWILGAGMCFTALLGGLLLVLIARESSVRVEVERQTAVIREAQEKLGEAMARVEYSNAELARSNAELEQFAYVASHDLQAPLRGVVGFAQLLQRRHRSGLDPEGQEFVGLVVNGALHMQKLITDLLTLARVGRQSVPRALLRCEDVLAHVLVQLQPQIEERGATVTHAELPAVEGTLLELTQLFQNLVGNAIKFGGTPPRVNIMARRTDGFWDFAVIDNGIGIAPEHRERVFQPFKRLHDASRYEGTGIGLAICKKIVDHYGGRIWVEDAPGGGAAFHFTLPAIPTEARPR